MSVIVRFAPSPTGFLHIGGARTALFNYLFARHHGGQFLLRIEDTDRKRSTQDSIDVIFQSIAWLGLDFDGEPVFQFARFKRHQEVAYDLVEKGEAYFCYCSCDELDAMREEAVKNKHRYRYSGKCRYRTDHPSDINPVVRLKAPSSGMTIIYDLIQGEVKVQNDQLDDMILLRSDGTPTYMLSVVVDDHDMNITHIIRGDDHLTNAFRQYQLYEACGWDVPAFAHMPLIHGSDGAKLSKRHGATGTKDYEDMGILPEAMRNYLLRLGWAHGDDEIISTPQAIEWFSLDAIGRSPSRFDLQKLLSLNAHYLRRTDDHILVDYFKRLEPVINERLLKGMKGLKDRSKTINDLLKQGKFYIQKPIVQNIEYPVYFPDLVKELSELNDFSKETIEAYFRQFCEKKSLKLGDASKVARLLLTGLTVSPSIFEIMSILGQSETLDRLRYEKKT
jgi:glutamyl-tRNA synthetase